MDWCITSTHVIISMEKVIIPKKKYGEGVNVCGDGGKFCSEWCDVTIGGVNMYEDFKSKKVGDSGALIFSLYILIKKRRLCFETVGTLIFKFILGEIFLIKMLKKIN